MKHLTLYFCSVCGAELEIREGDWRLVDSRNLVAYCEGCWRKQSAGSASGRSYLDIKSNRREPLLGRGSDEKRVANDGARYTRAQFERYYKDKDMADSQWRRAATRRPIGGTPLLIAFDDDPVQSKIDKIVKELDDALGAEGIPRANFPGDACALV